MHYLITYLYLSYVSTVRKPSKLIIILLATYWNLKQLDENKFRESLQKAPWDAAFVFENIDDVVNAWVDLFTQVVNDHIPFKQKRI